ncbi:MAG TPA: hypothetical protein EYO33_13830 [Phycisphaerales bacterium]|nr:hypothetical protein [Phycisphaerales bacterium]
MSYSQRQGPSFRIEKALSGISAYESKVATEEYSLEPGEEFLGRIRAEIENDVEIFLTNRVLFFPSLNGKATIVRYEEITRLTCPTDKDSRELSFQAKGTRLNFNCANPFAMYTYLNRVLVDFKRAKA